LLVAAEMGNIFFVDFMLNGGFSTEAHDTNAQTLAWNGKHFDIVLKLLKSNHTFHGIDIHECPESIKEFIQVSHDLNESMILRDAAKVLEIVANNKEMKHFYNLDNESALAFALKNKLFDMYKLLISKNVRFGPHEKFSKIKDSMKQSDKEELREIHYEESKFLPDNHMHVLLSNSRLGHDTTDTEKKYEIIQKAFEILNENPFIQVILMIVAASRNFRIIFDFNCDSVELMDPTTNETTRGMFYSTGRIYIAVKKLLDERAKYDALGTLVHELCHYAVNVVYKNYAKPYVFGDDLKKSELEEILNYCKENSGKEEIIDLAHQCYPHHMQHAELIVRPPHLIMQYWNNSQKFKEIRMVFIKLFDLFENRVISDMREALPSIETKAECEVQTKNRKIRNLKLISLVGGLLSIIVIISGVLVTRSIFYKPTYKFSTLSPSDKLKIVTAPIDYKNIRLEFRDLFQNPSKAAEKLTSDHISLKLIGNKPLNLSDFHTFYLNGFINHNWKNLTQKLKQKILNSNFTFQNQNVKFGYFNQSVLESLTSEQIIDILENKTYVVHEQIISGTNMFIERKFFDEMIYEIYFKYMIHVSGGHIRKDCKYSMRKNETFEDFYQKFTSIGLSIQTEKLIDLAYNEQYIACSDSDFQLTDVHNSSKVVDTLLSHKSLQLDFDGVFKEARDKRIFILSAEEGAGKTETFQQFTLRIRSKFPSWWISYIDLKELIEIDPKFDDVKFILEKYSAPEFRNDFERKIYSECINSGNAVLLWDGLDDIPHKFYNKFLNVIKAIWNETEIIQFISANPENSMSPMMMFSVKSYTFIPLDVIEQENFLKQFIIPFNGSKIPIIRQIISSISTEYDSMIQLLLRMIAELMSNGRDILGTEMRYEIFEKFLNMKIEVLTESKFEKTINLKKYYQKIAFKIVPKSFTFILNSQKLEIMKLDIPYNQTDEILRIRMLGKNESEKYEFVNKFSAEFFITQYLIENIYELNELDDSSIEELDLRLRAFCGAFENDRVMNLIDIFLNSQNTKEKPQKFNSKISNLLRTKFRRIFVDVVNANNTEIVPILMNFFSKDHELLIDLLQINQAKTFYTELFNYANSEPYDTYYYYEMDLEEIRSSAESHLNETEYEKFIHGHNQKGIMLISLYCYYMKEISFVEDGDDNADGNAVLINDQYVLEKKYLRNHKPRKVFESIAKKLTTDEYKELLTSKTILSPIQVITDKIYIFDQNILNEIEEKLTIQEQKQWLESVIQVISLSENKTLTNIFLRKFDEIFSSSEIVKIFQNNKILQITAYYDFRNSNFDQLWTFYVNHSTREEQKLYLSQNIDVECTEEFALKTFPILRHSKYECSLFLSLNTLQYTFLTMRHKKMLTIYEKYFNISEIHDMIISSDDFLPFIMKYYDLRICKTIFLDLKAYFIDNKSSLREFLIKSRQIISGFNDFQDKIYFLSNIIEGLSE